MQMSESYINISCPSSLSLMIQAVIPVLPQIKLDGIVRQSPCPSILTLCSLSCLEMWPSTRESAFCWNVELVAYPHPESRGPSTTTLSLVYSKISNAKEKSLH